MFANFSAKVQTKGKSRDEYILDEVLAILDMVENGVSKEEIATITGRSKDSLNYKIFEGQTTINEKTNVRSVKRFWYKNPKVKAEDNLVDTETALKALFAHYKAEWKGEEDVQARIEAFKVSLEPAAVEATA